jgi:hydrogenase nickel incorporation protein HypA/HybF
MHELSIAMSIVDMVEEESARLGGKQIAAVHLKLGALSGVVKGALLSSYDLACEHTILAGSTLVIEDVPIVVHCPRCDARRRVQSIQSFCCVACGEFTAEVLEGRELLVTALEIRE